MDKIIIRNSVNRLYEVDILRIFLIIVLLTDHAFAPFGGLWPPFEGQFEIPSYHFISELSASLFLQMFVFISGYVYGMKCKMANEFDYKKELAKKFKRLIIPSLFFSAIYYIIFEDVNQPILCIIYGIASGCGHLWFLPMLFWCFVITVLSEYFRLNHYFVLLISVLISLVAFVPLPFRMATTLGYFFFFYLGFVLKRMDVNLAVFYKTQFIIVTIVLYFICFIADQHVNIQGQDESRIVDNVSRIIISDIVRMFYAFCGIVAFYLISIRMSPQLSKRLKAVFFKIARYCFGIYIYQQFLLELLYYNISWKGHFVIYILPWVGILFAGLGSIFLTYLTLKLPYFKSLLG